MGQERRSAERLRLLGDLRGEVTVYEPIAVTELAAGGAKIETSAPLRLNSLHTIRLSLGERSVVVQARVVHCEVVDVDIDHLLYQAGVEFVEPPALVAQAIQAFIDHLTQERGA